MKKMLASLIFLFFSVSIFACSCIRFGTPFDYFSNSELVADVTIEKVYPAEKKFEKQYYKVDLKYNRIYKGLAVKSMYVLGNITINNKMFGSFTSCSLGFKVGKRLTIFESKDKAGQYVLHYCSRRINNEPEYSKNINYSISQKILGSIAPLKTPTNFKNLYIDFNFDLEKQTNDLDVVKGLVAKNRFAVYEIEINKDGQIDKVNALQSFLSDKDDEILEIIKKNKVIINQGNMNRINEDEKFLFILFYYPSDKNLKSFVSQHYL